MASDSTPVSSMSRHPGLNWGPTDYEADDGPSAIHPPEGEHRLSKHDSAGRSTIIPRWVGLFLALALSGCAPSPKPDRWTRDACLQRQIFTDCLAHVPTGPAAPSFNDWDEVVDSCRAAAREQSIRDCSTVKSECSEGGQCVRLGEVRQ